MASARRRSASFIKKKLWLFALLVLGPTKLPSAARQVGRAVNELRRMSSGFQRELQDALEEPMAETKAMIDGEVAETRSLVDGEVAQTSPPVDGTVTDPGANTDGDTTPAPGDMPARSALSARVERTRDSCRHGMPFGSPVVPDV